MAGRQCDAGSCWARFDRRPASTSRSAAARAGLTGCLPRVCAASRIPAAHQRSAIVPSRQRLTFLKCSGQISIMDSMGLVERSVRARPWSYNVSPFCHLLQEPSASPARST
jgi:hypothetical protein